MKKKVVLSVMVPQAPIAPSIVSLVLAPAILPMGKGIVYESSLGLLANMIRNIVSVAGAVSPFLVRHL
jgi:hypothetical protein